MTNHEPTIDHLDEVLGAALPLVIVTEPFPSPAHLPDTRIAYLNSALLADLGFADDLAEGKETGTLKGLLYHLADEPGPVDRYLEILEREFLVRDHEIPLCGPNGKRMVVQGSSRLLGLVKGAYYMQGIFSDVTRRHTLEARLLKHQEQMERDLDLAGWVQRSLIPKSVRTKRVAVEVRYLPAAFVGGDFVDFQMVGDDIVYITVCDVSGHGVAAALLANRVNSEVRRWIGQGLPPAEIVTSLNWFFGLHFGTRGVFLSIFIGRIDLRKGEFTYSGAGHPPAMLLRAPDGLIEPLASEYPLVGAVDRLERQTATARAPLRTGDKVVLYTDGLFEVTGVEGTMLGAEGLHRILQEHAREAAMDLATGLIDSVEAFRAGSRKDDISLLILEARAIPQSASSPGRARSGRRKR